MYIFYNCKEMINDVVGIHVGNFMSVQVITTFDVGMLLYN